MAEEQMQQEAKVVYNCLGQVVTQADLQLKSDEYGKRLPDGSFDINWVEPNDDVDEHGFDKHYIGTNGYVDKIILEVGTMLCRFGGPGGNLTAPVGADYDKLGLPYVKETREYHEYKVTAQFAVDRGLVAPMFDSPGGNVQYFQKVKIKKLLDDNFIEEDFKWLEDVKERNSRS